MFEDFRDLAILAEDLEKGLLAVSEEIWYCDWVPGLVAVELVFFDFSYVDFLDCEIRGVAVEDFSDLGLLLSIVIWKSEF